MKLKSSAGIKKFFKRSPAPQPTPTIEQLQHQLVKQDRRNKVMYLMAMVTVGLISFGYEHNTGRINSIQQQGCTIQKRGLSATPYLAKFVGDASLLLTNLPPETPVETPQQQQERNTLLDMRYSATRYSSIISKQPKTRKC